MISPWELQLENDPVYKYANVPRGARLQLSSVFLMRPVSQKELLYSFVLFSLIYFSNIWRRNQRRIHRCCCQRGEWLKDNLCIHTSANILLNEGLPAHVCVLGKFFCSTQARLGRRCSQTGHEHQCPQRCCRPVRWLLLANLSTPLF